MRALIVTNMYPTSERPALGSFVRDQVHALRRIPGVGVEVFAFAPGAARAYAGAAAGLRRRFGLERFDIVHAHFGLSAWPALAARGRHHAVTMHGTDLTHPRSRLITLAALRLVDLAGVVSEQLAGQVPRWAARAPVSVLPCGVDMERFRPMARGEARAALGLRRDQPYLLFPADPRRPEKRYDRALAVAGDVPVQALGAVVPEQVPLWVNGANAVLVPSDREGFGLAVLEALACDVPVFATPAGIAPELLREVPGAHCGPFDAGVWRDRLAPHLTADDPRVDGRRHAEPFSCDRMAARVLAAWRALDGADHS